MSICNVTKMGVYEVTRDRHGNERAGALRFSGTLDECAGFIARHMPCAILKPVKNAAKASRAVADLINLITLFI